MDTIENKEVSKRDRHIGRLREKYPDKSFENDDEIYGQISEDYDNYEKELGGYREREKALSDMFASDPRSAEFLTEMSKGGNPVLSLLKNFGPDIKEALDDPEKMQELADAWAEEQQRIAQSKQLDDEYAENLPKSLEALQKFQEERGLTDEQTDEIIFHLINIVRDGVMGKFSPEMFDLMTKAINHDEDVADAQEEGEVAGRNQKVTEKLRKSKNGDGLAPLNGKNNQQGSRKQDMDIFDIANMA
ncbi:MAG: hypothetical protein MSG77_04845 [Prevotella sp.]|nr:hypothetical protein [Prevotella sp.]